MGVQRGCNVGCGTLSPGCGCLGWLFGMQVTAQACSWALVITCEAWQSTGSCLFEQSGYTQGVDPRSTAGASTGQIFNAVWCFQGLGVN